MNAHLHKHAEDVLARAKELSSKRYWESNISPDFVVMFLPLESLLSSALETNGLLLEEVFTRNVVLATPTTILGMLRTIQFGYQRKLMADNAEEIRATGAEMLTGSKAVDHLGTLRKGLMAVRVQRVHRFDGQQGSSPQNEGTRRRVLDGLGTTVRCDGDSASRGRRVNDAPGSQRRRSLVVRPSPHVKDVKVLRSPGGRYADVCPAWVRAQASGSTTMTQSNSIPWPAGREHGDGGIELRCAAETEARLGQQLAQMGQQRVGCDHGAASVLGRHRLRVLRNSESGRDASTTSDPSRIGSMGGSPPLPAADAWPHPRSTGDR